MTLCAQFLLQALKPCNIFVQEQVACCSLRISRRDPCNVSTPREKAGEVRFVTLWDFVFLPRSCAVCLANLVMCASALSSGRLGTQVIFLSGPALRPDVHIVYVLESSFLNNSAWMTRHMM